MTREALGDIAGASAGAEEPTVQDDDAQQLESGNPNVEEDEHYHASHRSPWLRALVLGANDALVSVSSLMIGVGGGSESSRTLLLAGVAALVAGALSMAVGELISVYSQRDTEQADIQKEIDAQNAGPEMRLLELNELTKIYVDRGLTPDLARQVAEQLTRTDVIRAHVRDELGIDMHALANPWQASFASAIAFTIGGVFPLIPAVIFRHHAVARLIAIAVGATVGMVITGVTGAVLGGAGVVVPTLRVVCGGWLAMGITYGVGRVFNVSGVA